jgi:uncharacterized protein (DUF58 family)
VRASARERRAFPLVPRQRLTRLPFGDLPGRRRGHGIEVIGARPYEPGDPVGAIDWFASARLSTARGGDEFVVRDHAVDEAPRVAIVVDRRPAMGLYPTPLPWLSKRDALREAVTAIVVSASSARADLALLDFAGGEAWWLPPGRRERSRLVLERESDETPFDAPEDSLERAAEFLARRRADLPDGSFVFVLSDFLGPAAAAWQGPVTSGWDVVPVVIQDPIWERSFPAVAGVAVPVAEPDGRAAGLVRLSRRQVDERREHNESRYARLVGDLEDRGLRPVVLATSDPLAIDRAFLEWSEERRYGRWAR